MIKANLEQIRGGAVLAIVMDGHGAYESVTVFRPYRRTESATLYNTIFGEVDIAYSFRSTFKMLDRKRSGLYTGKALKGETFIVTDYEDACRQADAIYERKRKVWLNPRKRDTEDASYRQLKTVGVL
jgi:hypothetical protein